MPSDIPSQNSPMSIPAAEEAGLQRCRWYMYRYGIDSPQVMGCLMRWQEIIDELRTPGATSS